MVMSFLGKVASTMDYWNTMKQTNKQTIQVQKSNHPFRCTLASGLGCGVWQVEAILKLPLKGP